MVQAEISYEQRGEQLIETLTAESNPQLDAKVVNWLSEKDNEIRINSVTLRLGADTYVYNYGADNQVIGLDRL